MSACTVPYIQCDELHAMTYKVHITHAQGPVPLHQADTCISAAQACSGSGCGRVPSQWAADRTD